MSAVKSSGAVVAALGASEDDQLRGTVGQENSLRSLNPQPLRAGNGVSCDACRTPIAPKPGSRRQRYCCSACRQARYRARKRVGRCQTPRVTIDCSVPLELVGHGFRWPDAARRSEIVAVIHNIVTTEAGGAAP
jgi:hypothetical protein